MTSRKDEPSGRKGITGWPAVAATVAASFLVVIWATQWRTTGEADWKFWVVAAVLPGLALAWVEVVRRTRWFYLELAALLAAIAVLIRGWMELGEGLLAGLAALVVAAAIYLIWGRVQLKR